jgi:uncharacterized phiE125 gp8 family phage protein
MSLQITTQPTAEPVTVDEVKARLRLNSTADDATIAGHIMAAREFAEKVTRRSLAYKSYAYVMDRFPYPHEPIRVPVPPLIAVSAIKYLDATLTQQTWDPTEYFVGAMQSPAIIIPNPIAAGGMVYPCTAPVPGAVEIDFTAGYDYAGDANATPPIAPGPACPEFLREGIRQLAVHIYEHPEAVTSEGLKEMPLALSAFFGAAKVYVF